MGLYIYYQMLILFGNVLFCGPGLLPLLKTLLRSQKYAQEILSCFNGT